MSKNANPTVVGGFTFGALVILVGIILVFGSGKFMKHTFAYVLYFDESVNGLDVGAPVIFRGVKIGAVKDITLVYDSSKDELRIPVVIELYKGAAVLTGGDKVISRDRLPVWIDRGFRGRLEAQSLLTGKMSITLDFYPGTPVRLVPGTIDLPQIPTIPTPMRALTQKLSELPFEEIVLDVQKAMQGISEIMNQDSQMRYEMTQLIQSLTAASDNMSALAGALARQPESLLKGKSQEERY
jgi:paraquat-inducible protein B